MGHETIEKDYFLLLCFLSISPSLLYSPESAKLDFPPSLTKMLSVSFLTALALLLQLTCASPTSINNKTPTPTTPFTLAAFYSPYPPGSNASGSYGVSGIRVRAFGGSFWVNPPNQKLATGCGELKGKKCPPGNETVLFVDSWGQAWLVSSCGNMEVKKNG